jgi:nucleoside-diphosphate-sugar epimerase
VNLLKDTALDDKVKTVLVTGGTGTIGRHLIPHLKEAGFHVVCLSRDKAREPVIPADKFFYGSFSDDAFMEAALANVDVVIHAAAVTRALLAKNYDENVHIMQSVLSAAQKNHVKTIIHLSSDLAENPEGAYGKSKSICEELVANCEGFSTRLNLRLSPFVAKPEYANNSTLVKLMAAVYQGKTLFLPNAGGWYLKPVYWQDFVSCIEVIIRRDGDLLSGTYSLTGQEICLKEFLQLYARFYGDKQAKIVSIPKWLFNYGVSFLSLLPYISLVVVESGKRARYEPSTHEEKNSLALMGLRPVNLVDVMPEYRF